MRISPISNNYYSKVNSNNRQNQNVSQPAFSANLPRLLQVRTLLTKEGKAVYDYVQKGCPRTEEGLAQYNKIFGTDAGRIDLVNFHRSNLSIENILDKCNDNPEVINRALGHYGLELYGKLPLIEPLSALPWGSTIAKTTGNVVETGYYYPENNMYDNFIRYIHHNPRGHISDIVKRFGDNSVSYAEHFVPTGQTRTFLDGYSVLDSEWIDILARTIDSNNIHQMVNKLYV